MDMPVGGTAIGKALIASNRLIERSNEGRGDEDGVDRRSKVVILLTDGEDHEGDPIAAAQELKAAGIKVYAVGIGSGSGEPIPSYTADGTLTGHVKGCGRPFGHDLAQLRERRHPPKRSRRSREGGT